MTSGREGDEPTVMDWESCVVGLVRLRNAVHVIDVSHNRMRSRRNGVGPTVGADSDRGSCGQRPDYVAIG